MKNKKRLIHDLNKQGLYFEDFVFSSLCQEVEGIHRYKEVEQKKTRVIFDGYTNHGIRGITSNKTYIEVKYANNVHSFRKCVESFKQIKNDSSLVIICLASEKDISTNPVEDGVFILGSSYVSRLIEKHPREWWIFVASCSLNNRLLYDESHNFIRVQNPPLAAIALGKEITLNESSPEELSKVSEADFKRRIEAFNNPAIILGNGVSIHFGSDLWNRMSDSLFDYLSPKYVDNVDLVKRTIGGSTYSSTSMSRFTIDSKKYFNALYYSIYRKYEKEMHVDSTLIRSIVKIKQKNIKMPLLTYNYDDFLETDYYLHTDHIIKSVSSKRANNNTPEPKIAHVHGLLPYKMPSRKTKLILTQEEYYDMYKGKKWVSEIQREVLENNTCLYVGSSMSDLFQMSIINEINNKYYQNEKPYPWKCFALLCLKGMTAKDVVAVFNYFLSKGIYIIFENDYDLLPRKLLELFDM